jgi:hypothetical protein
VCVGGGGDSHTLLVVGRSGGRASKELVMCGFSKWKHAIGDFHNRQKSNCHVNSVHTSGKQLDERSGKHSC